MLASSAVVLLNKRNREVTKSKSGRFFYVSELCGSPGWSKHVQLLWWIKECINFESKLFVFVLCAVVLQYMQSTPAHCVQVVHSTVFCANHILCSLRKSKFPQHSASLSWLRLVSWTVEHTHQVCVWKFWLPVTVTRYTMGDTDWTQKLQFTSSIFKCFLTFDLQPVMFCE